MVNLYWQSARPFDPSRPTVILVHPAWMDLRFFDETLAQLSELDGTINRVNYIAVDMNGHGKTFEQGRSRFDVWDQADDFIALLDSLKISSAIFIGMSLGAVAVLHTAIKYPSRVSALALMAIQITKTTEATKKNVEAMIKVWTATPHPSEEIMNAAIIGWGGNSDPNSDRARLIKDRWVADISGIAKVQPVFDFQLTAEDLTGRLSEIQCPVLIIHGTEDATFPFREAEIVADGLVNAKSKELVPIEGSGHLLLGMRKGEDVVARLEKFVAEVTL